MAMAEVMATLRDNAQNARWPEAKAVTIEHHRELRRPRASSSIKSEKLRFYLTKQCGGRVAIAPAAAAASSAPWLKAAWPMLAMAAAATRHRHQS